MFDEVPQPIQFSSKRVLAGTALSVVQIIYGVFSIFVGRYSEFGYIWSALGVAGLVMWTQRRRNVSDEKPISIRDEERT
jgi:hypothetical protein